MASVSWNDHGVWLWSLPPLLIWFGLLLLPWLPWRVRERLEPASGSASAIELADVTVLIPARNEADVLAQTLASLQAQGPGLKIVVIDDQSTDGTAEVAAGFAGVTVLSGQPLPQGWAGKLWALEQGRKLATTGLTLLLDADIVLQPGMLAALLAKRRQHGAHFISLMADLRRTSVWDRLLLPTFVYYFKLLYPFALANGPRRWAAAAAGGCILVETAALQQVGAFASLRDALIDDCTLARQIKRAGLRTWTGLSRGVISLRPYGTLRSVHDMVARSAFTQLGYSSLVLAGVSLIFAASYWLPLGLLLVPPARPFALASLAAMWVSYLPTLRYYRMAPWWGLALPFSASLYLAMTWSSAIRYWRGTRSLWKGRSYQA